MTNVEILPSAHFFGCALTKLKVQKLVELFDWREDDALTYLSLRTGAPMSMVFAWREGRAVMPKRLRYLCESLPVLEIAL
jgi:hypothetical protein